MPEPSKTLWQRIGLRCALLAALIPLLAMGLPAMWYLLGPFVLALLLAVPLQRPIRWMEKRLRMKRWIAVLILLLLVYILIGLFAYWFLSFAVTQAIAALQSAPQAIEQLSGLYRLFRQWLTGQFEAGFDFSRLDSIINQALAQLATWASQLAGFLVTATVNVAGRVPGFLLFLNFQILGGYFITRDYPAIRQRIFPYDPGSATGRLQASALEAVFGYLRMQFLYTIFVLSISAVYLSAFQVPYAFVIACVAALLEFLPIFGNGTLYVPLIIILYLVGESRYATIILVVHLVFYLTRKVTEPRVMKKQMGLPPILSLLTMYLGLQIGSVLGLTLAPIISVVLLAAYRDGVFRGMIADFRDGFRWVRAKLKRSLPAADEPPAAPEPQPEAAGDAGNAGQEGTEAHD